MSSRLRQVHCYNRVMRIIVGIDEVGRGCWAGPLVAGAVALPVDFVLQHNASWLLADSKILSREQRRQSDAAIRQLASTVGLGWVTAAEVDELGLTLAVGLAMRRALATIDPSYDDLVIDGSYNFLPDNPKARTIIKADASVPAVSAASIVAKVARDQFMAEQAHRFPDYGFETHVGYGTKRHIEALHRHGICELHRKSFRPVRQFC